MPTTRQELEQRLTQLQTEFTEYKKLVRERVIEEGEDRGLDCGELDVFLESIKLEPRGANFKVLVPYYVRANDQDHALELVGERVQTPRGAYSPQNPRFEFTATPVPDVEDALIETVPPDQQLGPVATREGEDMTGKTKADLEQELAETKRQAEEYKENTRDEIIAEATHQGLTCEVLDEFLERVDLEPRGENFVVTVPVSVRADNDEQAKELATQNIVPGAGTGMDLAGEGSVTVDWENVTVEKAPG